MNAILKIFKEGFGSAFTVFDYIELLIVLCLCTALFGFSIWEIIASILETGSKPYLILFILLLVISASAIIRDIVNRKIGNMSKLLLACWGICILIAGWIWMINSEEKNITIG